MTIEQYIENIAAKHGQGNSTEHTFRGLLEQLIESTAPGIRATNEPKRQSCGAPDYILTKNDIPIGFIEAKDIGEKDLEGAKKNGNKEQFDRYKAALGNLIFTDYLDFYLYRDGELTSRIAIGELTGNGIKPLPENFPHFINFLKSFCAHSGQTVSNPQKLAEMMAAKARLLADVLEKSLVSDEETKEDSTLKDQLDAFRLFLIHDITPRGFADVYAQTIVYGMFAARLRDPVLAVFSRQKAAGLIPKSNPFLRKLFGYIAGPDIDERIGWIVDDLANIFLACDVAEILKDYGKGTGTEDPIIHFYETFLGEYDPKLRKARGVWYTPAPAVGFIVRAVDDILKTDFGLPRGLADNSYVEPQGLRLGVTPIHKVQILDPATGTGTFLAETVKHIYKGFEGQEGVWSPYVEKQLLPRLNGFELLMASYAMAHLKLDMVLAETGYKPAGHQRFRVYLTNSLEESHPDAKTLFADWLSDEANEANRIKRDTPVMCVMGNPPYSVSSTNKGEWILRLLEDYKKGLNEKNIQPLSDDYIKFIRLGQHFIDKNGTGVLAFITNNSFLDGLTHRQMRKSLLGSFDKTYILNLHGSAKKQETCPDGSPDQNIFDIMQGVSINIFVKTGKKPQTDLGEVFHADLFGKKKHKYVLLNSSTLQSIEWDNLKYDNPNFFFVKKVFEDKIGYETGFSVADLFTLNSVGIVTSKDAILISDSQKGLAKNIEGYYKSRYNGAFTKKIAYRIFDEKYIYYDVKLIDRARDKVMQHLLHPNVALIAPKQAIKGFNHVFISNTVCDKNLIDSAGQFGAGNVFPLYLYPEQENDAEKSEQRKNLEVLLEESKVIAENFQKGFVKIQKMFAALPNPDAEIKKYYKEQEKAGAKLNEKTEKIRQQIAALSAPAMFEQQKRKPNLDKAIVWRIGDALGLPFVSEKDEDSSFIIHHSFAPIDVLDYIYAVLHSRAYREKYNEFLKIDFPKIPYPKNKETFWRLVKLGEEIRQSHLLENPRLENHPIQYPIHGDNLVSKPRYSDGRVYINDSQYFGNVPQTAWEFFIGGYQPAQKWLKDRKDRKLEAAEITHYQKIIAALSETERLMAEIDEED